MSGRSFIALARAALVAAAFFCGTVQSFAAEKITVFAAASLKNALDAVAKAWKAESGNESTISYASSSALARQIEQGAPADVFISADLDWMDYLAGKKLVDPASVTDLLGNRIVLIAPADSTVETTIAPGFDIASLLGDSRLAIATVDAVPAGKYGKAALEALGVWESVKDRLAQAENVRAALALVATGEAPLGIVYRTDAAAEPKVKIVGIFPEDTHPAIIYPAGRVAASTRTEAAAFLDFLRSGTARALFASEGFAVLSPMPSN